MIASAPGKVILFGEHAVVYKRHAVVSAINLRCYVKVERSDRFRIKSPLGITGLDFEIHPYVSHAIKRFSEIRRVNGVDVEIKSEIPIASGLGSSSAVTVAVLKALDGLFETGLSDEDVFDLARRVELDVQGIGSGTDPFVSTFGKTWLIPERKRLDAGNLKLLVVNTGKKSITGDMVKKVAELRERYEGVVEKLFDAMDEIALKSVDALKRGDLETLGYLFFANQCLLKAIGVSDDAIDRVVERLSGFGISAKITGAGGGGCVIGIGDFEGLDLDGFESFIVDLNAEGVRIED
jgi:mevalonate kinase